MHSVVPVPDLPPSDEITTARRRLFDRRHPNGAPGPGPIGIAAPPRDGASITPQVNELESIRDRLLEDVEAMTARLTELEHLAEGAAEEQRRQAAEEERERRERWAELERLAAARVERPALPRPEPETRTEVESEVVGPAAPAAPSAVTEPVEPRGRSRRGRIAVAAIAGLLIGAAGAAGAATALDSDSETAAPARPAAAAAPAPGKQVPLCREVPSDVDIVCDTGSRLFIAGQGWPADLGTLKARVVETKLVGATAAVALELTSTRDQPLDLSPERLYLTVGGRKFGAAPLDPVVLDEGAKETLTLQFLLDQPALDALAAKEGEADLGLVPPGAEPDTRLGVLRVTLQPES